MYLVLEIIITISSPVIVALCHESINELLALGIIEHPSSREEAIFELLDGLLATLEARQIVLTQEHHFNNDDDLLGALLKSHEALPHQLSEFSELLGAVTSENLNQFRIQFERSRFELQALAWRIRQKETEVNVEEMPLNIKHDVLIVPVLDLENVAHE